jgi:eukaryotic-like serine/threonine-protein kinase
MKDDWSAIEEIFHAARELHGEARSKFLDKACGLDDAVRRNVEVLLERDEKDATLLDRSAAAMVRMTLAPGTSIGPYEIVDIAGIGGMGQVYRARDPRLKRTVAIKALPAFAHDSKRIARFEQEATLLASLNHPNIGGIYDVVEVAAERYLVLEFVEGSTLAERLQSGPIPVGETIQIVQQIASALEIAHEKGIVHRDLKPSNIKIAVDGRVKVLDFGLAKIFAETETRAGMHPAAIFSESDRSLAMGTPSYMSPEQARGDAVDKRSDIWAFGCILYELLTGQRAFASGDAPGTVESILKREPDWNLLPRRTPAALARLLRQCLEKDCTRRLQSAKDLRRIIEGIQAGRQRTYWVRIAAIVAIIAFAGSVLLGIMYIRKSGGLRVAETQQITLARELELDPALSPDGNWLAYACGTPRHMDIYVRQMSDSTDRNLTRDLGSVYSRWPRWSPDGKLLAFVANNWKVSNYAKYQSGESIWIIPRTGGKPRFVAEGGSLGHTWSPDGKKLAYLIDNNIYVIDLDSGISDKIAEASDPHSPSWSPNGKWIAFVSGNQQMLFTLGTMGNIAASRIGIIDVKTHNKRWLTDSLKSNSSPVWMPDSKSLLFLSNRGGSRDVFELKVSSTGEAAGEPVRVTADLDALSIDISVDGRRLAYAKFLLKSNLASLPIPKAGTVSSATAVLLTTGAQTIEGVNISRDRKWIVYDSNRSGNMDIYKMLSVGGSEAQLTHSPQDDFQPNLSPDGQFIAFYSFRNGNRDIYMMSADGTDEQQVTNDPAQERYPDWSPDGRSLVFFSDKTGQQEVYRVSQENGKWGLPVQLTFTENGAMNPRWSPDGKTIVYGDILKGLSLISPDGKNPRVLVAKRWGLWPMYAAWSADSKTIYFRAADDRNSWSIFAVPSEGGAYRMLVRFDEIVRYEFAADDKDFFFTIPERESDIWMLRLER